MQEVDEAFEYAMTLQESSSFDWRSIAFDKQIAFIEDPHRLKCAFTTRRGAKSYADGIYLIKESIENEAANCLYLGLTRLSAKGIIWKDVLKHINTRCELGFKFHETELTATAPNGSVIYVAGVDVDEDERKKLFGRKYKLVVIDEAALFGIDLRDLVYVVLRPAIADLRGTIVLSGMASNITRGLFYDITNGKEKGWNVHKWSAHDNPYMAKQWQEELDFISQNQPQLMGTARFRQAYLNEWVVDEEKLVYKFNDHRNIYSDLPQAHSPGWTYILGVDTGWEDDNAFVLCAFHENLPELYIIKTFNKPKMTFDQVVEKIREFMADETHSPAKIIIDGANKQGIESMRSRSGIPFEYADKQGKVDFIEMLNGDFVQGKIKINQNCQTLISELKALIWKTDGEAIVLPKKEDPRLPNHLCFIAGTKIETSLGPKNIEDVIVNDEVLTRDGYKKVLRSGLTGISDVVRLTMTNGHTIICTPDHPIYTFNREFVTANDLDSRDKCYAIPNNSMGQSSIVTEKGPITLGRLKRKGSHYIERFTNFITDQYLEDGTFTIKTTTRSITILRILRLCQKTSIWMSMLKKNLFVAKVLKCSNTSNQLDHSPKNGTPLKKVDIGTKIMQFVGRKKIERKSKLNVQYVRNPILETVLAMVRNSSAHPSVILKSEGNLVSIMNQDSADGVIQTSPPTNILNNSFVVGLATRETLTQKEKVYGLQVSEKHEYFANGVLVSNCDAMLYAWRNGYHYQSEPTQERIPVGSRKWYEKQVNNQWERERAAIEKSYMMESEDSSGWPTQEPL